MRRKLILFLILSCLFLSSASLTFAYLTDNQEKVNEISPTDNRIHIEEAFNPPDTIDPGTVITKSPRIINDSEISVWTRMAVYFSDSNAEKFCEPLQINDGWSLHTDGYYYYDHALAPGERTVSLFDSVKIRETITKQDLVPFDITVYAESVQAEDFENQEAAWKSFTGGSL